MPYKQESARIIEKNNLQKESARIIEKNNLQKISAEEMAVNFN